MSAYQVVWLPNTAYTVLAVVVPTTFAGYTWRCSVAGTSGNTDPFIGNDPSLNPTVTDGGVTWQVGTGFRQAFQEALANITTGIIVPFAQANPTVLRSARTTRPLSFTNAALPCFFLGDITEQSVTMNGVRQRNLFGEAFAVDNPGDPRVPNDKFNFLADVLADLVTANYHAVSGRSILTYNGMSDTAFPEGSTEFPALRLEFQASVQEGRI